MNILVSLHQSCHKWTEFRCWTRLVSCLHGSKFLGRIFDVIWVLVGVVEECKFTERFLLSLGVKRGSPRTGHVVR